MSGQQLKVRKIKQTEDGEYSILATNGLPEAYKKAINKVRTKIWYHIKRSHGSNTKKCHCNCHVKKKTSKKGKTNLFHLKSKNNQI